MTAIPQTPPGPPPAAPAKTAAEPQQVTVVSHSNLFYWWPVWAVGFIMAIATLIDGHLMYTVPKGTIATKELKYAGDVREGLVFPKGEPVERIDTTADADVLQPKLHMAKSKNVGVIFCVVLLLVIVITNVPLRGMWSLVVIITIIMLSIIFALAGWWDKIFARLDLLDIRINMGGYLFISTILFGIWLFTLLLFDKQVYIVFEPGQFRVCTEIGGGEKVYDATGLTLERQKGDLFRHYILGLGSGDLIVKTHGAQAHHFDLPNVLFIGRKLQAIERVVRARRMLEQQGS